MSRKLRNAFFCSACGHEEPKWFGHCTACGAWNTAAEAPATGGGRPADRVSPSFARWRAAAGAAPATPVALGAVETAAEERTGTGLAELDRVLGGGVVAGSLVLVGGDPGIGKSTLLLQLARSLAAAGRPVLYVAGEESERQVRLRAARLGEVPESLFIVCETDLEAVLAAAAAMAPAALIVDSIQTLARGDLEGGPGSVTQVRECGLGLMHFAKGSRTAVFLVGHVTKDGAVAGPRVLEHMVDAVLYLEGERYQNFRVLRAAKNRFGATHELGVFEMGDRGLTEVANPSEAFLSRRGAPGQPGAAVVASLEGTRPLLVEVQALVSTSFYGTPQRVTTGFDSRRLAVLLAVLERRVGLRLGRHDVFVTVTGGLSLDEPGTDLGVALAVASSFRNRPVLDGTMAAGEVSLSGEIRRVPHLEARVREAARLGFTRVGVPAVQAADLKRGAVEIVPVATLREAIDVLLGAKAEVEPAAARPPAAPGVAGPAPYPPELRQPPAVRPRR